MTITNEEIEKKLAAQLPLIELPSPTMESLAQRIEARRRNRRFRSGAAAVFACCMLGVFASRWMSTIPNDESSTIVADHRTVEEQTDRTLEQIEDLQRVVSSLPVSSATKDIESAPFRVFATWRIPVVVKSTRPESKSLERLNVLEITKKLDPRSLSLDEIRAVEKLLPDQQSAWNQL